MEVVPSSRDLSGNGLLLRWDQQYHQYLSDFHTCSGGAKFFPSIPKAGMRSSTHQSDGFYLMVAKLLSPQLSICLDQGAIFSKI